MSKFQLLLIALLTFFVVSSCNKTSDWRDTHVGSYTMQSNYEIPIRNLTTGQILYYQLVQDTLITNHNVQLTKSDYSDKYVVKLDGAFLMDVDKDGYCSLKGGGMYFVKDTLHLTIDNLNDTMKWGRHHLEGLKN
jgi:hypothetical protein